MGKIGNELKKLKDKNIIRLAMPGSKGRYESDFSYDFTEIGNLDNLSHPEGVIIESEKEAADIYSTLDALYLVNGSTVGNISAIYCLFNEGDYVLVDRNSHKSIINALIIRKIKAVFIENDAYKGISLPIHEDKIIKRINRLKNDGIDIKGIILTNPSYNGYFFNYDKLSKYVRANGILFYMDAAHGAHLYKEPYFKNADVLTISTHKTMNSLNQAAILLSNMKDMKEKLRKAVNMFQTSSPSYLILKSIEDALLAIKDFDDYSQLKSIKSPLVLQDDELVEKYNLIRKDPFKVTLYLKNRGRDIFTYLLKNNIYAEYHDINSTLLMFSPYNTKDEIVEVLEVIKKLEEDILLEDGLELKKNEYNINEEKIPQIPKKHHEIYECYDSELININKAEGRISEAEIIIYPPGSAVIIRGESFSREIIEHIIENKNHNRDIIGVKIKNDEILVSIKVRGK